MTAARHSRTAQHNRWTPPVPLKFLMRGAGVFVVLAAAISLATPSGASAETVQLNGFNCTKVEKTNGGFTLDCNPPGGTPSSSSTSPSPTPTASSTQGTPSPSPTTPSASPSTIPPTSSTSSPSSSASHPPPSPSPSTGCPVAGTHKPGASDNAGGCWPGPGNTGVPAGTVLTPYTGPCTITVVNTIIDSKQVNCTTLSIRASGIIIRRSFLNNVDVEDSSVASASFRIEDSKVSNGAREQCLCIGDHNFVALRVEVIGGNRSAYCARNCVITDSWFHGQQLQGAQHGSGLREEQFTTARHNTLVCDYPIVNDATTLGCSSDLTGYADFAPIHDNTIDHNLFLASLTVSYCAYGGASGPKPFSGDPLNATNQVFTGNVFQRGPNGHCGQYQPVGDFAVGRPGNVFTGNVWDNGGAVPVG